MRGKLVRFVLAAFLCSGALAQHAVAQDLNVALSSAEGDVAAAEAEIQTAEVGLHPAEARYAAQAKAAKPADQAARAAHARVAGVKSRFTARQKAAAARVHAIEAKRQEESEEQDETVETGLALGIAALLAAGIAVAWGWFRASAAVAALTEMKLEQALGVCIGGAFLLLVIGAVIGGFVGMLILSLAIIFCVALLLARHSAEIQRGKARPITGRERFPQWSRQVAAALLGALALLLFGGAIFAGGPQQGSASAALRSQAEGKVDEAAERRLADLETVEGHLQAKAERLDAARQVASERLATVRGNVSAAKHRLARAEGQVDRISSRLVALTEREEREEQREIEEAAEREKEELIELEEEAAEECDPNYSGCLDPNAIDYDCAGGSGDGPLYTGPVEVLGVDHYGLDADGDGIGCDS